LLFRIANKTIAHILNTSGLAILKRNIDMVRLGIDCTVLSNDAEQKQLENVGIKIIHK
jgi:hypothetical protein